MVLAAVLEDRGVDFAAVLDEFGLGLSVFEDPENTLPFALAGNLLGRCAELTGCRHLGLVMGQNLGLSVMGAIGLLAQSAPTARHALLAAAHHMHLHDRGAVVTLRIEGDQAVLSYAVIVEIEGGAEVICDLATTVARNIVAALCGPTWRATEVRIAHAAPADLAPYRKAFQAPLRFDAEENAVVFPAKWLEQPVASADPLMHRFMSARVREIAFASGSDFLDEAKRVIHAAMLHADCSAAMVARRLGVSERTLNRRLRESGVTFARLRDDMKKAEACRILESTRMSVGQVALILGYSSDSAFSRAFKTWHGVGPARWRARRRDSGASATRKARTGKRP